MSTIMPELARWDGFYVILGSAAGALIGLQFIALTLLAERPMAGSEQATAAFGHPIVVHFGAVLFLSALLHAPWQKITIVSVVWGVLGLAGVAYTAVIIRRLRNQTVYKPVFEDWLFHVVLPMAAYMVLTLSLFAAFSHIGEALFGVGGAALLLLFTGIHNSYDNISHIVLVRILNANQEQLRDEGELKNELKS
jgi:hypothetical protein